MNRRAMFLSSGALIFFAVVAHAQLPEQEPVATAPPASARYELIQNSRAMKETYLLDRYTGNSWQLVQSTKRYAWQRMTKEAHEKDLIPKDWSGPAYQVSVSGLAAKGTYMINVITGATWVLFEDPEGGIFWGAIPEPE
jgi:hypothetical protein